MRYFIMVYHFVLYCKCIWPSNDIFVFLFAHITPNPDLNPKPNLKKGTTIESTIFCKKVKYSKIKMKDHI
jgi:hypothetical protein